MAAMAHVSKTMENKPAMTGNDMTGNGKHTAYKNGDDWGIVFLIVLPTLLH